MTIDGLPLARRTAPDPDTASPIRRPRIDARARVRRRAPSRHLPFGGFLALLALLAVGVASANETSGVGERTTAVETAWAAVARGEAVAVMRHALAPGTDDPPGFDVEDCATQRNLSGEGREQAERIGERVAAALGTTDVDVLSSAWCRCRDTARLLGLGEVSTLPALNSTFRGRGDADAQTAELRRWIDERIARDGAPPAVLVTHQVNITALTGGSATSGEIVIVDAADDILARIAIP